jgi:uncharacterized protein YndB with AHSA1/START domain
MANEYGDILRREIVTTRVLDAPRDLVFEAWTDPEQLRLWWGPRGFSNTFHEIEVAPGGVWTYTMHGPDGTNYENEMRFVEIVTPEKIVIDHQTTPRFTLTVLFDDYRGKTKITFRQLFETEQVYEAIRKLATQGNEENFDRLAGHVAEKAAGRRSR